MQTRIINFSSQQFCAQIDHGGVGMVLASRARRLGEGVNCNFIDCVVVPPGATIGVHTHESDNEELYIMLSGRGIMMIENQEHDVSEGDVIVNPPGGTHGLRNCGETDIRLVVVEYPVVPQR
jgi:mannose-6-phosphate isomerase-like protein (cupin superfamily)